jgi:hypothetical protein
MSAMCSLNKVDSLVISKSSTYTHTQLTLAKILCSINSRKYGEFVPLVIFSLFALGSRKRASIPQKVCANRNRADHLSTGNRISSIRNCTNVYVYAWGLTRPMLPASLVPGCQFSIHLFANEPCSRQTKTQMWMLESRRGIGSQFTWARLYITQSGRGISGGG